MRFKTEADAKAFIGSQIDQPVHELEALIGQHTTLRRFPYQIDTDQFTNIYDVSLPIDRADASLLLPSKLTSPFNYAESRYHDVITSGGFFFLADSYSSAPRVFALNAAIADSRVINLPVDDQEAVTVDSEGRLSMTYLKALGRLSINGIEMTWAGSSSCHETDAFVYANGNCIIDRIDDSVTGSARVLRESSILTPPLDDQSQVDIAFERVGD